jgi:hypothetical protein
MRKLSSVVVPSVVVLASVLAVAALAQGPPPGWGKPAPLPPPNGTGQVTFKQGGTAMTLPLSRIEIQNPAKDMRIVTVEYVDASQENKLDLTFMSSPALPNVDEKTITGFNVKTKAKGLSRVAGNRSKCRFAVTKNDGREVAGTLSCTGMTDMSATAASPDVTDVTFSGRVK